MLYADVVAVLRANYSKMVRSWKRRGTKGASLGCIRQNVPTKGLVGFINPATFNAALVDAVQGCPINGFLVYWEP